MTQWVGNAVWQSCAVLGKGDLIGADLPGQEQVIKTNADVKALTYCDLQHISVRALREVLELYPEYAVRFADDIHHSLTYNLRAGSEAEGLTRFSRSPRVPHRLDHSGHPEHKLPSAGGHADRHEDHFHLSPASKSRRNLMLPSLGSPVRRTSLGSLLGDELRQFNALRRCRSPARGCQARSPSPSHQSRAEHHRPPQTPLRGSVHDAGNSHKPSKLPIPSLNCFGPPDLSPRVVDGIEDNGRTFHFNMERNGARAGGNRPPDSSQVTTTLLLETEEVRQSVCQLNKEMSLLNQEVAQLTKELHHMMHFLQAHVAVQHYTSTLSTYPYGVHVVSNPSTTSSMAYNVAAGLHLHHEPLSHHTGGAWSFGGAHGNTSQARGAAMCQPAHTENCHLVDHFHHTPSPRSSCLQTPCFTSSPQSAYGASIPVNLRHSHPSLGHQLPASYEHTFSTSTIPTSAHSAMTDHSGYRHLHVSTKPLLHPVGSKQSDPAASSAPLHILDTCSLLQVHLPANPPHSGPASVHRQPSVTSLDSGPSRQDISDSDHPLGDSAGVEHISLECLLSEQSSLGRRDSETPKSRRSSVGIQTSDTEPFWTIDMAD